MKVAAGGVRVAGGGHWRRLIARELINNQRTSNQRPPALLQHRLHVYKPRVHWGFERFYRLHIVYIVVYTSLTWIERQRGNLNTSRALVWPHLLHSRFCAKFRKVSLLLVSRRPLWR